MSAFRGLVLLGAAGAAVSTLGMRAAEQAAPQDPSAQYQLATQLYESARYREALGAYEQVAQTGDYQGIAIIGRISNTNDRQWIG